MKTLARVLSLADVFLAVGLTPDVARITDELFRRGMEAMAPQSGTTRFETLMPIIGLTK